MTPYEYGLRMTAYQLKRLDEQEALHYQAWLNTRVQDRKKEAGKEVPIYKTFKKFFDKEKFEKEILGVETQEVIQTPKQTKLLKLMKKANS